MPNREHLMKLKIEIILSVIAVIIALLTLLFGNNIYERFFSHSMPSISVATSNVECIHPQILAQQKGWTDDGATGDKYGGWYVELNKPDQLPVMWEALGERHIYQTDTDRTLSPGRWAIYTPFDCRDQFGFSH
jgi:hypothetical protein